MRVFAAIASFALVRRLCGAALLMAASAATPALAQVSVLTQHNDTQRTGVNAAETVLKPGNVNSQQFGLLFKLPVDDQVFAQPLVAARVSIGGGVHAVVFVATSNNSVYAFDARTGAPYWHVNFGPAITKQQAQWSCEDVLGTSGIMSTPVIRGTTLYVVAQTYVNGVASHALHALSLSTGAELVAPATIAGSGFTSLTELQRTALLAANGNIYFSFSSHCDQGSYKGLTFAYNATTLARVGVFDASPSQNGNGIWQSGNGPAADRAGHVYWVTGNGGWDGTSNFSESVLKADANLNLLDWYTPSNHKGLDDFDLDLTTSGPLLLPGNQAMVAGGKDGVLHLLPLADLGHLGAGNSQAFQATPSHIHSLVFFGSDLFMWGQADVLRVFHFDGRHFATTPIYVGDMQAVGHPGATLSLSANGRQDAILWAATNIYGKKDGSGAWHKTEPGVLAALRLPDMSVIWTSKQRVDRDDCGNYAKFIPPTIANGLVYLPSFGSAQTNSGQVCVYGLLQPAG